MRYNIIFILIALLTNCTTTPKPLQPQPASTRTYQIYQAPALVKEEFVLDEHSFEIWLNNFKQKAIRNGISKQTVEKSFRLTKPLSKVILLDRKQPEHKITKEEYIQKVISDVRIQKGRRLMAENHELLNQISKKYNIEPEFIIALWGLETGYGSNTGSFNVISALASLAYEGRRKDFFESELLSALLIIDDGHISASNMLGSWAGAMGQCQFMPSSFLSYATDYDKDGKRDIWQNKQDILASIANYLSSVGWGKDKISKEKALMHWNKSNYFVSSVFILADAIKNEG